MLIKMNIPGSKSHSNRALILAALSSGTITIKNVAICDDTNYLVTNLKKLGVKIQQKNTTIKITGVYKNGKLNFPQSKKIITLYTGNAGTTTRFLTALATLTGNEIIIDGDSRMRERPIEELTKNLNKLGAKIETTKDCPPLHVYPQILEGGEVKLSGNISSQYLSALLMVAPFVDKRTIINISEDLCSKPYITMTLKVMKEFGLKVQNKNFKKFVITPINSEESMPVWSGRRKPLVIESDASSASYFGAYAAIYSQKILLQNIHKNSLQGDIKFIEYLKKMGCKIIEEKGKNSGTYIKGPTDLKSLGTIDMNETPDLVMTFAVLALFTKGKTRITNIANLRIKETDRLQALENELKKLGATVKTGKDWIEIQGIVEFNRLKTIDVDELQNSYSTSKHNKSNTQINTYNDHRIAMSFGILTDLIPNLKIENPDCVSKSYPNFWQDLRKIGNKSNKVKNPHSSSKRHQPNIVLTGLRGSGKSKIGAILALKLNMNFIDIDEEIEKEEKKKIPEIINSRGWEYFRAIECKVTQKVSKLKNTVISTGGGTILNHENEKALKKNSKIIYLYVKPEIATKRILNDKNRPPLTNKESVEEEMKQLYKERNGRYCESANIIFERSENVEKDCNEIIEKLHQ